jgi:uridine kinase
MMATVTITPARGEPQVASWHVQPLATVAAELLDRLGPGRRVVAVDGRGGGGKTTLARRLADCMPDSAVVGTDDIAWNHSIFDWSDLLIDGVLRPYRAGSAVAYRPPAWVRHGREGAVQVPDTVRLLIIEGVGASRTELSAWLDASCWVQSDFAEAERRGIARDVASGVNGDAEATIAFWHTWMAEELPFFERDRPWERADLIVAGTSATPPPDGTVAVGRWQHDPEEA